LRMRGRTQHENRHCENCLFHIETPGGHSKHWEQRVSRHKPGWGRLTKPQACVAYTTG
jgi:hypothetical protein